MSEELELISHGLDKVINKLQKRYPTHDFTKKSKPRKKNARRNRQKLHFRAHN